MMVHVLDMPYRPYLLISNNEVRESGILYDYMVGVAAVSCKPLFGHYYL